MSWLDKYFTGVTTVQSAGVAQPQAPILNFTNATVSTNPATGITSVTTGGGGSGGTELASSFTMPAVGSTVVAAMVTGGGASFQKNNAVNVNVSGAPSNFTVTLVSGDNVTLLNNGGPFNVAPAGTVPAASIVTVASTNAPIAAVNPLESQALAIVGGLATPTDMQPVINVRRFGVLPTNSGAVNATNFNAMIATLNALGTFPRIFVPGGNYPLSSTVIYGSATPAALSMLNMYGDCGGDSNQSIFTWTGAAGVDMFVVQNVLDIRIRDISFYGANLARTCVHAKPFNTSTSYTDCSFSSAQVIPTWKPSTVYTTNVSIVKTPTVIGSSTLMDGGHAYMCTTGGTSNSAGVGPPTFPTADGATVTEASGVVWKEIGPSPVAFLQGDFDPNPVDSDTQADDATWTRCSFNGPSVGWRAVPGGNVKNYTHRDCAYRGCAIAVDWRYASGRMVVDAPKMLGNGFDFIQSANTVGSLVVNGIEGEGSACLIAGNIGGTLPTQATFQGGYWAGDTSGLGVPVAARDGAGISGDTVHFGGMLSLENLKLTDSNAASNYPRIVMQGLTANGPAAFRSKHSLYHFADAYTGPFLPPVFDVAGNAWREGWQASYSGYRLNDVRYSSEGDIGVNISETVYHNMPRDEGQNLMGCGDSLHITPGVDQVTSPGVVVVSTGGPNKPAKLTIPYTAIQARAVFQGTVHKAVLNLAQVWNRTLIKRIYADVTTALGNVAGITMAVGDQTPWTSGTITANSFLLATTVDSTKFIGRVSGDLGANLSSAVQGGYMLWGSASVVNTDQWGIQVTFDAGAGLIANLNAGSVNIYIQPEVMVL